MHGIKTGIVLLQPRDRRLLSELQVMRVVDRELAKIVCGFRSTTRANTRLLALTEAGYLKRSFIGTIAGGRKSVYRLSRKGLASSQSQGSTGKNSYSELFLEHQLQINQVYVSVKYRPIPIESCQFHRWIAFNRVLSKASPIIPDGYFELTHNSQIKSLFLEVDLGTEALRVWQKKIESYLRLATSGEFKSLFGGERFKVAIVANSGRRVDSIRKVAAQSTDKIFRFTSLENTKTAGFWSPIWNKPTGERPEALL